GDATRDPVVPPDHRHLEGRRTTLQEILAATDSAHHVENAKQVLIDQGGRRCTNVVTAHLSLSLGVSHFRNSTCLRDGDALGCPMAYKAASPNVLKVCHRPSCSRLLGSERDPSAGRVVK